eukprot:12927238-Prorocentrum_lima.AAC.1
MPLRVSFQVRAGVGWPGGRGRDTCAAYAYVQLLLLQKPYVPIVGYDMPRAFSYHMVSDLGA